jgi:hypothetical protein
MNAFFRAWLVKFFSLLVSLKVMLLTLTTILLLDGKITESSWTKVIIALAAARIAVQTVNAVKNRVTNELEK